LQRARKRITIPSMASSDGCDPKATKSSSGNPWDSEPLFAGGHPPMLFARGLGGKLEIQHR
jgi:hypothetical protein